VSQVAAGRLDELLAARSAANARFFVDEAERLVGEVLKDLMTHERSPS